MGCCHSDEAREDTDGGFDAVAAGVGSTAKCSPPPPPGRQPPPPPPETGSPSPSSPRSPTCGDGDCAALANGSAGGVALTPPGGEAERDKKDNEEERGGEQKKEKEEEEAEVQLARPRNQQSLAQTAAEAEAERALRESILGGAGGPGGPVAGFEMVFDDASEDPAAAADGGAAADDGGANACVAFDEASIPEEDAGAALSLEPVRDESFEDSSLRLLSTEWFAERGAVPPTSVVWHQTPSEVCVEISPADADVGYELRNGRKLCYNCGRAPPAEAGTAPSPGAEVNFFTTSLTGSRRVRSGCRDMERQLEYNRVPFTVMDIADNAFLRKKCVAAVEAAMPAAELRSELAAQEEADSGAQRAEVPLPLLFVGTQFVGTVRRVQEMIDDDTFIATLHRLGATHVVGPPRPMGSGSHRMDLVLLHPVAGAVFTVAGGVLTVTAAKATRGQYWPQLCVGPRPQYEKLRWIRRDSSRDVDDDKA